MFSCSLHEAVLSMKRASIGMKIQIGDGTQVLFRAVYVAIPVSTALCGNQLCRKIDLF